MTVLLKPLLVAVALLMPVGLASYGVLEASGHLRGTNLADDEPGVHLSNDGTELHLDESALPAGTGWFVAAITVDAPAELLIRTRTSENATMGMTQGQGRILMLPGMDRPMFDGWVDSSPSPASVAAGGNRVQCCGPVTELAASLGIEETLVNGWGGGHDETHAWLEPGQLLHIGLAAYGWGDDDHYDALITSDGATLSVAEIYQGERVAAVDMVDAARGAGTEASLFGATLLSEPGTAAIAWEADHYGLVTTQTWVEGDARAELEVRLPNGTTFDNGPGSNGSHYVNAATAPGTTTVILRNLDQPDQLERLAANVDGAGAGANGWVQAIAFFVDLDVPFGLPGAWAHLSAADEELSFEDWVAQDPGTEVFTDALLPGATGWFIVPLAVDQRTELLVRTELDLAGKGDGVVAAVPILLVPDHGANFGWSPVVTPATPLAVHTGDGQRTCCPSLPQALAGSAGAGSFGGLWIEPGSPIFLGLAVQGWNPDAGDAFQAGVRAVDGTLSVGDVRTGTGVVAFDLVDEAYKNGQNVRLGDTTLVGDAGDATETVILGDAGLVVARLDVDRGARARLSVDLPNGTSLTHEPEHAFGFTLGALTGPGELVLRLTDLEGRSTTGTVQGETGGSVWAHAVVADLDVPAGYEFLWTETWRW